MDGPIAAIIFFISVPYLSCKSLAPLAAILPTAPRHPALEFAGQVEIPACDGSRAAEKEQTTLGGT